MYSVKGATIYVLCEQSGEKLEKIAVNTNRVTFGSYPLNNVRLHTLNTERLHCKIFADSSNTVTIVNYSQSNPVLVNNCSVKCTTNLHDNDKFEVAGCLFLWNFNPVNIKMVPKTSKRTVQQCRRKTITLKRVRSSGDIEKYSRAIVPRSVSLLLDAYRKRRTIHSSISGQSLCDANISNNQCDSNNLTKNGNALAEVCTPTVVYATQSNLTPSVTPLIEKENIVPANMHELLTGDLANKSHTPVSKRRHLACHTPVSHLIDLTTPPAKSRATSTAHKASSGKAVQSPRLLDVVNIVTPSPKKINRTPISLRTAATTPKTTLLKSAIKNSRTHEPDSKKTPLSSAFVKKTPNVKLNTPRINTPKPTPTGVKSSTPKIRKHLISSLNDKKAVPAYKTDSPVPIINLEESTKHSTPTLRKRPSAATQRRSVCVTPKGQLLERCNMQKLDNVVTFTKTEKNAEVESPSVVPIIDVESIIKKPNRTTQIRSAKYSDITPHESFADGIPSAAAPLEENVIVLQAETSMSTTYGTLQDELKCVSSMPSNANHNRNSCSSVIATLCSESSQKTRKTMSDISSTLLGSPLRPLSHNKLNQSNMASLDDLSKDTNMVALPTVIISTEEDFNENDFLAESDLNPPLQNDTASTTPELRHSWRHTRKCIGSAFTSLNTSRPQLDLTAEIDESLVFTEDEEAVPDNNELYNLECSNSLSTTGEEQMVPDNAGMNNRNTLQISETTTETTSDLLSRSLRAELMFVNVDTISDCALTKPNNASENAAKREASICKENVLDLEKSEIIPSNFDKHIKEVEEISRSQATIADVPETAAKTSSDLLFHSLDKDPAFGNADDNSECSAPEMEQVLGDASRQETKNFPENVLHFETSELNSSNMDKDMEEENMSGSQNSDVPETATDTTSDLLSHSLDEEAACIKEDKNSECSAAEEEQDEEDVTEQNVDGSTKNVLLVETSELFSSNIDEDIKEVEDISGSQTSDVPETAAETLLDLLSHSLDEESAFGNADKNSECSAAEMEQFQGDAEVQNHSHSADVSTKNELHLESSELISSNINEDIKEVEDISGSQASDVPETAAETSLDLLSHSLDEESAFGNADKNSECSAAEMEQFQGDAEVQNHSHSADNVLHLETSELISSNIDEDIKEVEEISGPQTSDVTENAAETSLDLLSHSLVEEPAFGDADNNSECSAAEMEQVQGDAEEQDHSHSADDSTKNELHLETSEVIPSHIDKDIKEVEEISGPQTSDVTEYAAETSLDLLSHSLDEETASTNEDKSSRCSVTEEEQVEEDVIEQNHSNSADDYTKNELHLESSELIPSNINEDINKVEEISGPQTSDVTENAAETSLGLLAYSLVEESAFGDADNNSECSAAEMEQVQGDAEEQDHSHSADVSTKNELHLESSELISSNINEDIKEVEDISGSQASDVPETAAETSLDSLSHSLDEESAFGNADKNSECSAAEMEQFQGDAEVQNHSHSADNVLHLETSELISSNIDEDIKEVEEISGPQTSDVTENAAETSLGLLSHSLVEEPAFGDADNNSECSAAEMEQVQGDAEEQDHSHSADVSTKNELHLESSELISSYINEDIKEVEEISGPQTSDVPEKAAESSSDLLSDSLDEKPTSSISCNNSKCSATEQKLVQKDAAEKITLSKAGENVQNLETSVQNVNFENNENLPTTPKVSKRRLYSKNNYANLTPEQMVESPQATHFAIPDGYPNHPKTEKYHKKTQDAENQIRENRPKRTCRLKITNLSEGFLAGNSPVPKFVKPKPEITKNNDTFAAEEKSESSITQNATVDLSNFTEEKKSVAGLAHTSNVVAPENSQQEKVESAVAKKGRVRKKALLEETSIANTPVKKGRGRKKNTETADLYTKPLGEAKIEQEVTTSGGEIIKRSVDLRRDEDNQKTEQKNQPEMEKQAAEPTELGSMSTDEKEKQEDKPTVAKKGRSRKQAVLEETSSERTPVRKGRGRRAVETVKEVAVTEKSLGDAEVVVPEVDIKRVVGMCSDKGGAAEPVEDNLMAPADKEKPIVAKKGRSRKQVVIEETSSERTPVRKGRGRRAVVTVKEVVATEKSLGDAEVIEPEVDIKRFVDKRSDDDNQETQIKLASQAVEPVESNLMVTDDKEKQTDKPTLARKGRSRKQALLEEPEPSLKTPVKKGRKAAENDSSQKSLSVVEIIAPDAAKPVRKGRKRMVDPRGDEGNQRTDNEIELSASKTRRAAEPAAVGSVSTDDKEKDTDKPTVARKGQAQKQAVLEDTSSKRTPIRKGRGRRAVETVKEEAATENPLGDAELIEPEVDIKRFVDKRSDDDNQETQIKLASQVVEPVESNLMVTDDKEKQTDKPTLARKGRSRKQIPLEEPEPSVKTPIRKGKNAAEKTKPIDSTENPLGKAEIVEPQVATPVRKGRRRKVDFELSDNEEKEKMEDVNELSLRTKRTRLQAQELVSDANDAVINEKKSISQTKVKRPAKKNEESVSDNTAVAESPKSEKLPRRTRAKRN